MIWKTALTKIEDSGEVIRGYSLQDLIVKKSFVEVIFLLLKGTLPTKNETAMVNALFTACIDHGVGAPSATVARTAASVGNSLHTALAAGVLTLGEHHGGAIEGAAKFFQEHQDEKDVVGLAKRLKEQKVRVPGYGHKVLTVDARSVTLLTLAKKLGFYGKSCVFAEAFGTALNKLASKPLPLNIDGSMAAIISNMGFDWRMARGFFIIGRVPGLVAQVYEEMTSGGGLRRIDESEIEYTGEENKKI